MKIGDIANPLRMQFLDGASPAFAAAPEILSRQIQRLLARASLS
jgi:hypothetical protein